MKYNNSTPDLLRFYFNKKHLFKNNGLTDGCHNSLLLGLIILDPFRVIKEHSGRGDLFSI